MPFLRSLSINYEIHGSDLSTIDPEVTDNSYLRKIFYAWKMLDISMTKKPIYIDSSHLTRKNIDLFVLSVFVELTYRFIDKFLCQHDASTIIGDYFSQRPTIIFV